MGANLFWFHRMFDRVDPDDSEVFSVAVFGVYVVVFAVVEGWNFDQYLQHQVRMVQQMGPQKERGGEVVEEPGGDEAVR